MTTANSSCRRGCIASRMERKVVVPFEVLAKLDVYVARAHLLV
jgi:hypothetical protein